MHISYLGPVSCFDSCPEFLIAHHREWQSLYGCQMAHIVSFLGLCPPDSEISFGGLESLMSATPILLIRQEIFHFSAIILTTMWAFIKSLKNILCGSLGAEDGHWTIHSVGVVHLLSRVRLFATPWKVAHQASLSITSSQSLLELMSNESVMLSNHLILCHPLLLPSIFPSIRIFSSESVLLIRWPKYWTFSFSISPSNEYSGLISFKTDLFDLLAVQGTLKSLLQHHSSKETILRPSAAFMVHLTAIHDYWKKTWLWLDGSLLAK